MSEIVPEETLSLDDMFEHKAFFIIGCPRSATTAVAKILDTARNAHVYVEQEPKKELCIAARNLFKKEVHEPIEIIKGLRDRQICTANEKGLVYGDKNPNYLQFVAYLDLIWKAKFIFIVRDGREVVRSSMGSYRHWRGNYYGLEEDGEKSDLDHPEQDWWDYSRLRPNSGDAYYDDWKKLSRFEKCCWNWNAFNSQILSQTSKLDKDKWRLININRVNSVDFEEVFSFLGLTGFDSKKVEEILLSRVNSLMEKAGITHDFPHWDNWSQEQSEIFSKHCATMMDRLGYCA